MVAAPLGWGASPVGAVCTLCMVTRWHCFISQHGSASRWGCSPGGHTVLPATASPGPCAPQPSIVFKFCAARAPYRHPKTAQSWGHHIPASSPPHKARGDPSALSTPQAPTHTAASSCLGERWCEVTPPKYPFLHLLARFTAVSRAALQGHLEHHPQPPGATRGHCGRDHQDPSGLHHCR